MAMMLRRSSFPMPKFLGSYVILVMHPCIFSLRGGTLKSRLARGSNHLLRHGQSHSAPATLLSWSNLQSISHTTLREINLGIHNNGVLIYASHSSSLVSSFLNLSPKHRTDDHQCLHRAPHPHPHRPHLWPLLCFPRLPIQRRKS
jgi:hypothetical protein